MKIITIHDSPVRRVRFQTDKLFAVVVAAAAVLVLGVGRSIQPEKGEGSVRAVLACFVIFYSVACVERRGGNFHGWLVGYCCYYAVPLRSLLRVLPAAVLFLLVVELNEPITV